MVGPQKPKPSAFSAFDIATAAGVCVGASARERRCGCAGRPSTKSHRKAEKERPASRMSSQARAPRIVATILARLRTIPASAISTSTFAASKRAMRSGSNPSKAARKPSRFLRMVIQARPAWKPSRTSFSNRARSSYSGTPHSVS